MKALTKPFRLFRWTLLLYLSLFMTTFSFKLKAVNFLINLHLWHLVCLVIALVELQVEMYHLALVQLVIPLVNYINWFFVFLGVKVTSMCWLFISNFMEFLSVCVCVFFFVDKSLCLCVSKLLIDFVLYFCRCYSHRLYWITKRAGERQGSGLMKANAWHHRADAVSSVVALIGVGKEHFLF